MKREPHESTVDFVLRFEVAITEVKSHDTQVTINERLFTMMLIERSCMDPTHRALLLGKMKKELTPRKVVAVQKDIFTNDISYFTKSKTGKGPKDEGIKKL